MFCHFMKVALFLCGLIPLCCPMVVESALKEQTTLSPLLDQFEIWAKRHSAKRVRRSSEAKNKLGFFDRIFQANEFTEKRNEDAFIDSLVGMMSKSDPSLLLRLQDRLKKFQDKHYVSSVKRTRSSPDNGRRRLLSDRTPLIQFFNVTRISVGLPDEDDDLGVGDDLGRIANGGVHLRSGHRVPKREDKAEEDVALRVEMEDGKVAKILRSGDKKRYSLQIECTSRSRAQQEDAELRRARKSVEETTGEEEGAKGVFQGVIGKSEKVSNVYRSFNTNPPDKLSIII